MSASSHSASNRMPVLFVGHGSPMNAIKDNRWARGFASLGETVPRPSAILAVSAHWFIDGIYLTANARPKTIHDFGGFPQKLYEVEYLAPGKLDLAQRVRELLGEERAGIISTYNGAESEGDNGASVAGFPSQYPR